jgi:hypothetical protein
MLKGALRTGLAMLGMWLALACLLHAAGLTFEKSLLELQVAPDARMAVADFNFENATNKPVRITRYDKTCSCASVQISDGKLNYLPGEKGSVRATFDLSALAGVVDKMIVIWLEGDAAAKPSVTLTARINVPLLVVIDAKTLKWSVGSEPRPQKIEIRMNHTKPIRIVSFKTEMKTVEEGKHYQLWATPSSTEAPALAIIRIETDCEMARHKTQQAFVTVMRDPPVTGGANRP